MFRPLVILPSYNSGDNLPRSMRAARGFCNDVWAVVDASTDGSAALAERVAREVAGCRVIILEKNSGKGGAVLRALREAAGFTHAIVMDADGQHPADAIPEFLGRAKTAPGSLLAGVPVFGPDAPAERVRGRAVGNFFARVETWGMGARDSLFGFRLYPLAPALRVLESVRNGRRFDFDTVMAVRLLWAGVPAVDIPVPVRYPPSAEGGVTHFCYVRDNILLTRTHAQLVFGMLARIPALAAMRSRAGACSLR